MFKFLIQNFISLLFPSFIKVFLLNFIGHSIDKSVKIGPVVLGRLVKLNLAKDSSIGAFNVFMCHGVNLKEGAFIRRINRFQGAFDILLNEKSAIGNFNSFVNGGAKLIIGNPIFSLGKYSNLTSRHYFDLTDSIVIGSNTVIGGLSSQFWTHGFQHFNKGQVRLRVDGAITIGDGVYIGSRVIFNPNVNVCDEAALGAGAVISKNLLKPGLYVSPALRYFETSETDFFDKYSKEVLFNTDILVYKKKI
jgi:acetyltransferase-like isoleucine patch superfamily enzyme